MTLRLLAAALLLCSLAAPVQANAPAEPVQADAPATPQLAPAAPQTAPAMAARPATTRPPTTRPDAPPGVAAGASAGNLMQTIFALLAVLGLMAALAWILRRYGPKAAAGTAHVRMVGALNLGGRERIMVVEVGDQWIVVGASPGRVNALATMPRQPGAAPAPMAQPGLPMAGGFSDWLKQTIDKRNAK